MTIKRLIKNFLTLTIGMLASVSSFAQTDFLVGHRGNGSDAEMNIELIDTTGGILITATLTATTDYSDGIISGIYGMSLHPFTSEMYVVYGAQVDGGDANLRRLGTIDVATAEITDIGVCANVNDITFMDATLYANTGSNGGFGFGTVDITDGTFESILTHSNASSSNAIMFDYFNARFLKSTQGASTYEVIDPLNFSQTSLSNDGHPGWTTALVPVSADEFYSLGNDLFHTVNANEPFDFVETPGVFVDNEYVHSGVFTAYPTSLWSNGPRTGCVGTGTELVVINSSGTDYVWYLDGVEIDGADAASYTTEISGEYYVEIDGEATNPVILDFINVSSSFVASENPAFLEGAPSVDINFFETATGDDLTYAWDSGNGSTSDEENPTFTYTAIGTYVVSLIVTDNFSECTETYSEDVIVAGGVGLNELEIEFNIFPIPAANVVNISYTGNESYTTQLIGAKGDVVNTFTITPANQNTVDVSSLAPGTYYFSITNGTAVATYRFIKQ